MTDTANDTATDTAQTTLLAGLRCTAMGMVGYGWPVVRGTYFDGARWRGYPDAVDLRPVDKDWPTAWTLKPSQVTEWWTEQPYSVLLACGHGVDCVELPTFAGPRVLGALRSAEVRPPTMLTPVGTLVLFVRTDRAPHSRVLLSASVRSAGSWIPVPPTSDKRPCCRPTVPMGARRLTV